MRKIVTRKDMLFLAVQPADPSVLSAIESVCLNLDVRVLSTVTLYLKCIGAMSSSLLADYCKYAVCGGFVKFVRNTHTGQDNAGLITASLSHVLCMCVCLCLDLRYIGKRESTCGLLWRNLGSFSPISLVFLDPRYCRQYCRCWEYWKIACMV